MSFLASAPPVSAADELTPRRSLGLEMLPAAAAIAEVAETWRGRIAVVSSFGTQSAVLLHLVARADPSIPVIFLDTGKLFAETLQHRDRLVAALGLRDVRSIAPDPAALAARDPIGALWMRHPDACCTLRKAEPQARALAGFDLVITGRKRYQTAERQRLPLLEAASDGRYRLNPLAAWTEEMIEAYRAQHGLIAHPLAAEGYPSIGCRHCTDRVAPGEDPRAGRWRGRGKVECGMHPRGDARRATASE
ncbi:phosphoadenylyl-sulfate reductase [Roseomonas fluvialis]|uniref:Adenosine 5'-phosphosulfate reductase n=1 Tax=Roseomonas fluvialis TaxID=1750527 RepID=A0ABM7XYE6_9PROT|nr:phosphoadenylyl-sulfate reductase [Roseomonas fluvialis]BDG70526.1 phosphoadenosine phosphosulfate reductase [Roseomonas fluvialis]